MTVRRRALASDRVRIEYDSDAETVALADRDGRILLLTLHEGRDLQRTLALMLSKSAVKQMRRRPTVAEVPRLSEGER